MAKISTYPILSNPTINDILIGTDVEDLNITKNFSIGSIVDIVGNEFVPYVGATGNVNLGAFNITATSFIVAGGLSSQFLKANGTLDSTVYVPASRTLTINSVTYDLSANRSWDLNTIDTLTTIGTSGAATYIGKTLNIPQYQAQGSYITQLSGEATAVGPGNATVTLSNLAVISKVLTGLNITGGTISDTDSILTAFGKVQNQINGLAGGVTYEGTWNAATNTPTLTSSVGVQGHYYVVSVAGNTNLNGITDWQLGDWAIFNGSVWEKVDNTDAVVSVNGYTGAVVLTFSDVGAPPATRTLTINGTTFDLTANRSWTVGDVRTDQTYSNPTWISTLAWGKITGTPTTLAGYGITDGALNTTTLTINGTTFDLSANRTWNVGTVTSVGTSGPLTGGTITGSGTIGITQAGASSDGYLSSTDWNTFNNKQNALTNPVTGTGTIFTLPMWSGATSLVDSPLSYGPDTFNFQYNSATGGTVNFTNIGLTSYTYSIQMNNFGSPRSTIHSYTDGVVVQSIGGTQVSRVFANGNTILGAGVVDNGYKLEISGNLYVNSIVNATTDTDRFIVSDGGVIKYRTGSEILSDIGAQGALTLTTTGTSGPATLIGNTLNIPDYGGSLTGYVPYTGATQNLNLGTYGLLGDFVQFNLAPTSLPTAQGTMYWDTDKETIDVILNGTTGSIFQDTFFFVKNQTGVSIPKGTVVRANGTVGASGRILIAPFLADGTFDSKFCLGVTTENIADGDDGRVTYFGAIRKVDTSAYPNGTVLYASPSSPAGGFTSTEPSGPTNNIISVAIVVYSDSTNGEIFVRPTSVPSAIDIAKSLNYTPANQAIIISTTSPLQGGGDLSANRTLSITQATSTVDGYLSSTDWNTFNNKQNALTNPVTGTGTTNVVPKFTGTSTIGDSSIADNTNEVNITKRLFLNTGGQSILLTPNLGGSVNRIESSNLPLEIITLGLSLRLAAGGASTQVTLTSTGNFLIGTTTDSGLRLDVNGAAIIRSNLTVTATNATGDFATIDGSNTVRRRTAAQVLIDIGAQGALTNPVTGTGTTNYLPKFTGSTTIGNSQIFDNGTNVGINQAIPTRTLDILGASGIGTVLKLQGASGTTTYLQLAYNGATNAQSGYIGYNSSSQLQFFTNDTLALTIDSSRNLGLGVTPSAWASGFTAMQVRNASFWSTGNDASITANAYYDGSNYRFIGNAGASRVYHNTDGSIGWSQVASGTAGNAISFTQAMTLTSGGNLLVGTTTDAGFKLDVNGTGRFTKSSGAGNIISFSDATYGLDIASTATGGSLQTYNTNQTLDLKTFGTGSIIFSTANTERMRITSGGDVLIGTSTSFNHNGFGRFVNIRGGTNSVLYIGRSDAEANALQIGWTSSESYLYNITNTAFLFGTNNTERMRITSGGNVLIGTTTDAGFKLDVNGTGRFTSNLTVTTTTAPALDGSANAQILNYNGGNAINELGAGIVFNQRFDAINTSIIRVGGVFGIKTTATGGFGGGLAFYTQPGSSANMNLALRLDNTGAATFASSVTAVDGTDNNLYAALIHKNVTGGANSGLRVHTNGTDAGAGAYAFRVTSGNTVASPTNTIINALVNGNVGIGTSSPAWMFEVNKDTSSGSFGQYPAISINNPNASGFSAYYFFSGGSNKGGFEFSNGDNSLRFFNGAERMRITSGANVLIGTTTDVGARLYVDGAFRTGTLTAGTQTAAVDWRLGNARGGTATANALVRVQINGVLVDLIGNYV
jgi:hypothetical protein